LFRDPCAAVGGSAPSAPIRTVGPRAAGRSDDEMRRSEANLEALMASASTAFGFPNAAKEKSK
jgi:hypothetical protein